MAVGGSAMGQFKRFDLRVVSYKSIMPVNHRCVKRNTEGMGEMGERWIPPSCPPPMSPPAHLRMSNITTNPPEGDQPMKTSVNQEMFCLEEEEE